MTYLSLVKTQEFNINFREKKMYEAEWERKVGNTYKK